MEEITYGGGPGGTKSLKRAYAQLADELRDLVQRVKAKRVAEGCTPAHEVVTAVCQVQDWLSGQPVGATIDVHVKVLKEYLQGRSRAP
jgi:hypothetical protein